MKSNHFISVTALLLAGLIAVSLLTSSVAQPPKMKMTTDIPPGIATPDSLETRLGKLILRDDPKLVE